MPPEKIAFGSNRGILSIKVKLLLPIQHKETRSRSFRRPATSFLGFKNLKYEFEIVLILVLNIFGTAFSFASHLIVVAKDGTGDFTTITQAVDSLPMFNYERVVIFIKNGIYNEKIRIDQDYVTLQGESRDSTVIEYSQLRTDWIADMDPIGPAVVNIHADDVVLEDLTIRNTQPEVGPHAFSVYGDGTRTILLNCNVLSKGGDTVSLWNYKTGMYYHANCNFEGSVDFICPRGWCFMKDSRFYELKQTASIWHAGSYNINQKFVIRNSSFDGVKGFQLGRHHYEAQFFLLHCAFSENMADTPIYRVTYKDSLQNRPFNWGERDYYYDCHRKGGDFSWIADNLKTASGSPAPAEITPAWTFEHKWNPEDTAGPRVMRYEIQRGFILLIFPEPITVIGKPTLRSENGTTFVYDSGAGTDTLRFDSSEIVSSRDLAGLSVSHGGRLQGTIASVNERNVDLDVGIHE